MKLNEIEIRFALEQRDWERAVSIIAEHFGLRRDCIAPISGVRDRTSNLGLYKSNYYEILIGLDYGEWYGWTSESGFYREDGERDRKRFINIWVKDSSPSSDKTNCTNSIKAAI